MKLRVACVVVGLLSLALSPVQITLAQTSNQTAPQTASALPRLVRFNGTVKDLNGSPLSGVVGITFALYSEQSGGAALWLETQNVNADSNGRYTALLGSTKPTGLPADLFTSVQARWVGVQVSGQAEQPRVLLVSAPYALKAGDAETIGGFPPSAFVMANPTQPKGAQSSTPPPNAAVTGKGVADYIPMWDTTSDIVDSVIFQKSSAIGIETITPAATLDVNGKTDVRDTLTLFPKSTDNPLAVSGTAFNIASTGKVTFVTGQTFPGAGTITGITTASGSGLSGGGTTGTLSLKVPAAGITNAMLAASKITLNSNAAGGLTTPGAMTLGSTYTIGLKPCTANQILQYSGTAWNCVAPSGTGTITGVTAGTDLTGGGTAGKVTLNLNTAALETTLNALYPQLATGNIFKSYLEAYQTAGPGNAAVLGWGSSGSVGTFGDSDTGYGVQGESTSGFGVYGQATAPVAGSSGVIGFTGTAFSGTYTSEAGIADSGVWADHSGAGTGVPVALFATGDDAYGGAFVTNGVDYPALFVDNNGGTALEAQALTGYGVSGSTSSGTGVYGSTSGSGDGVEGFSSNVISQEAGVLGVANTSSATYGTFNVYAGVWGDTGTSSTTVAPAWAIGVLGTADDGHAGVFLNNSSGWATMYISNASTGGTGLAVAPGLFATLNASTRNGICGIGGNGDLTCTGQVKTLATTGGARTVETYAMQSPENWMEDFGSGTLQNGVAVVNIDPAFAETVSQTANYHVFITPNGDSKGLYVIRKTEGSFEVRESGGGTSSLSFDYRIVAKRRGYEAQRLTDVTERFQAEQKALNRHLGPQVRPAARPRPSPLLPKSHSTFRKTAAASPHPHVAPAPLAPATHH